MNQLINFFYNNFYLFNYFKINKKKAYETNGFFFYFIIYDNFNYENKAVYYYLG